MHSRFSDFYAVNCIFPVYGPAFVKILLRTFVWAFPVFFMLLVASSVILFRKFGVSLLRYPGQRLDELLHEKQFTRTSLFQKIVWFCDPRDVYDLI